MTAIDSSTHEIEIVIPLCPFERTLLQEIEARYHVPLDKPRPGPIEATDSDSPVNLHNPAWDSAPINLNQPEGVANSKDQLFHAWVWRSCVVDAVLCTQELEYLEIHGWNRGQAYSSLITELVSTNGRDLLRAKLFNEHNSGISGKLSRESPPIFRFVMHRFDAIFWDILLRIHTLNPHLFHLTNVGRCGDSLLVDRTYDIWQVVQQFSLTNRRPNNYIDVEEQLFRSLVFKNEFVIRPVLDRRKALHPLRLACGNVQIFKKESSPVDDTDMGQRTPENAIDTTESSDKQQPAIFRNSRTSTPMPDPRNYVEIIPWKELKPISTDKLREARISISLPRRTSRPGGDHSVNWVLWKPQSHYIFDCHHLYTEDEVYQYCVENRWHFPGHFLGDKVIFSLTRLEETAFVGDLPDFWTDWNDCALTSDTSDGQLYLLETIPGREYRFRRDPNDGRRGKRAQTYFRNLVEAHAQHEKSDTLLSALLGEGYNPKYKYMLRYLEPKQFVDVGSIPFATGSNGGVYAAVWREHSAVLCTTQLDIAVVIKHILPTLRREEAIEKFHKELDVTFTALEGGGHRCVKLKGFTSFRVDGAGRISTNHLSGGQKLFLVFERASEGNVMDFLEQHLNGLPRVESWCVIFEALGDIADGLQHLHGRHVTHGDLHPGNILVNKGYNPENGEEKYHCLLSDFGGGGYFGHHNVSSSTGRFTVPIGEYIAPEVRAGKHVSPEADLFSFGRIGRTLVSLRRSLSAKEGSMDWEAIPKALRQILIACEHTIPTERPKITPTILQIEGLLLIADESEGLFGDEDAWDMWSNEGSDQIVLSAPVKQSLSPLLAQLDGMLKEFG